MQESCDDFFARAVLSSDEYVSVSRANTFDEIEHRFHCRRLSYDLWQVVRLRHTVAQRHVLSFETTPASQRFTKFDLRPQDGEQTSVVPGLLDKVAGTASHRFNGEIHAAPCSHHNNRERGICSPNAGK